jgi:hypothetical protein
VDFGNIASKKKHKLFAITDEQPEIARTSHKLAIPCKLINAKEWSKDAFQAAFPEIQPFNVHIKEQEGDLYLVDVKAMAV